MKGVLSYAWRNYYCQKIHFLSHSMFERYNGSKNDHFMEGHLKRLTNIWQRSWRHWPKNVIVLKWKIIFMWHISKTWGYQTTICFNRYNIIWSKNRRNQRYLRCHWQIYCIEFKIVLSRWKRKSMERWHDMIKSQENILMINKYVNKLLLIN